MTHLGYHLLGIGVYHTGIEIGKQEYCFAGHEQENDTGVFATQPKLTPPNLLFKRSIYMGYSAREDVDRVLSDLSNEYTGSSYHLLTRNCNHFSNELCKRLTGKSLPGWINRAAKVGTLFPCILPTLWIDPPEIVMKPTSGSRIQSF
ncbi:PPPDE putative peptidase domain-containing protein [Sporodiniella umbellata]|nr:PPPDE putative peptidase domain-containing protein [Sporodiniella umbellata]